MTIAGASQNGTDGTSGAPGAAPMRFESPPSPGADGAGEPVSDGLAGGFGPDTASRERRGVPGLLLLTLVISLAIHGAAIAGVAWIIEHIRSRPPSARYMVVAMVDLGGPGALPGWGTSASSGNAAHSSENRAGALSGKVSHSHPSRQHGSARAGRVRRQKIKTERVKAGRSLPASVPSSRGEAERGVSLMPLPPSGGARAGSHAEGNSISSARGAAILTPGKAAPGGNSGSASGAGAKGSANSAGTGEGGGKAGAPGAGGFVVAQYAADPRPAYPDEARRAGEQGTVLLRVLVATDGSARRVEVAHSCGFTILDHAAADAVRQHWRFRPALKGRTAIQSWVLVPIRFRLNGRKE